MDSTSEFIAAARDGNVKVLRRLLKVEENYRFLDTNGSHPILLSISNRHVKCVKAFMKAAIRKGHNPLKKWPCDWRSLLTYAVVGGYFDSVQLICKYIDDNSRSLNKLWLHCDDINEAMVESVVYPNILTLLLDTFAWDTNYIGGAFGYGLLISSAEKNSPESMKILIQRGLEVDRQLIIYRPQWEVDVVNISHLEVIKKLIIDVGYDVKLLDLVDVVTYRLDNESMNIDIFKFLIEHGADVHLCIACPENWFENPKDVLVTPLFASAILGKVKLLKYLLTVTDQVKLGECKATSPVLGAIRSMRFECLKALLLSGYSIDGRLKGCKGCYPPDLCGKNVLRVVDFYAMSGSTGETCSFLELLLRENVLLTAEIINHLLFEDLLRRNIPGFSKVISILVKYGVLELLYGMDSPYQSFGQCVYKLYDEHCRKVNTASEEQQLEMYKNVQFLLDFLPVFHPRKDLLVSHDFEPLVLPLKKICRQKIRLCVFQNYQSLHFIETLGLPDALFGFLMCE